MALHSSSLLHMEPHIANCLVAHSLLVPAAAAGVQPDNVPACVHMKQELLTAIRALQLPINFLDQLIDELGGVEQVAEMTGRNG